MATVSVLLILVSAVMHASWNALARRTESPYAFFFSFNLVATVLWLPIALIAGWGDPPSPWDALLILGSGSLQVLYFVFLASAYQRGGLTLVYPIARGTSVALVPIAGYALFSERPSIAGWIGIATTLAGLGILAVASWQGIDRAGPGRSGSAAGFALLTGMVITSYSLVDNFGVGRINPVVYGYGLIAASAVLQLPYALTRRWPEVHRQLTANVRSVLAGSVLSLGTYLLVLVALTESNVGYVVPLRETSIVFAVIIGIIMLREPISRPRIVAALVIAAGSVCIAIGG
ncbi:MAG: EamA family transporter [Thermomicrobiales bacterium]